MCGFAFNLIFPLLLVRVLDQAQFGAYRQCFLVVLTMQNLLPLGMPASVAYFLPREEERGAEIIFNITAFLLVMGGLVCLLLNVWPESLSLIFHDKGIIAYGPLIGWLVLPTVFSSFLETVATARREIRLASVMIVISQVTRGMFMLGAVLWRPAIEVLLWAAILHATIQSVVLVWYLERCYATFWKGFHPVFFRQHLGYAAPTGVSTLVYSFFEDLHHYFVSRFYDAATYAVYSVGCLQIPFVAVIRDSIGQLVILQTSELQKQGRHEEILQLSLRVARKLSIMYWGMYAFFLACGHDLLILLYTRRYEGSWPILAIYLTLLPINIFMYDPVFRAYAEERYYILRLRMLLLAVLVGGLLLGIRYAGLVGAVSAVILVHLLERVFALQRVARILMFRRHHLEGMRDIWRFGLLAGGVGLVTAAFERAAFFPWQLLNLATSGLLFSGLYLGGAWAFNIFELDEKNQVRGQIAALRQRIAW